MYSAPLLRLDPIRTKYYTAKLVTAPVQASALWCPFQNKKLIPQAMGGLVCSLQVLGGLGVKEFGCLLVSGIGSVRIEFRAGFLIYIYIGIGLRGLRLHYIS